MKLVVDWQESVAAWVLVFGFVAVIVSRNLVFAEVVVLLAGLCVGRLWCIFGESGRFALFFSVVAVLVGLIVAMFLDWLLLTLFLFFLGAFAGFWLQRKGFINLA